MSRHKAGTRLARPRHGAGVRNRGVQALGWAQAGAGRHWRAGAGRHGRAGEGRAAAGEARSNRRGTQQAGRVEHGLLGGLGAAVHTGWAKLVHCAPGSVLTHFF